MRTSYSAIGTYKQCPQRYYFQEVEKIRVPKSREAIFGTLIHSTLRFMFSRDPLFPTLDEVIEHFRANWPKLENFNKDAVWDFQKSPWSESEEQAYFKQGVIMLKRFYEKNAPWNFHVVDLESRFAITLTDEKTGATHTIAGIIDRIDQLPDGGYEIIDYKTSKRMPAQEVINRDIQLSLYATGLQDRWPHLKPEEIMLSLYFIKHGEKLSTTANEKTAAETKEYFLKTIFEIEERLRRGKPFEPVPGPLCNWCGYRPLCPAWRHLYRKQADGKTLEKDEIDAAMAEYFAIKKREKEDKEKIATLQISIKAYMEQEQLTRIFGAGGVIAKKTVQRYAYDMEKIKAALEPLGKWEAILKADETKLKKILKELPIEARATIEEARRVAREYTVLSASSSKKAGATADGEEEAIEDGRIAQ